MGSSDKGKEKEQQRKRPTEDDQGPSKRPKSAPAQGNAETPAAPEQTSSSPPGVKARNQLVIAANLMKSEKHLENFPKAPVASRIRDHYFHAGKVIEMASPYRDTTKLLTMAPVGSNNSGKSYFVNCTTLKGLEGEARLASTLTPLEMKNWAQHFPVRSSSLGHQALTVFATHLRPSLAEHGAPLKAKLVFLSKEAFEKRTEALAKFFEKGQAPSPGWSRLCHRLLDLCDRLGLGTSDERDRIRAKLGPEEEVEKGEDTDEDSQDEGAQEEEDEGEEEEEELEEEEDTGQSSPEKGDRASDPLADFFEEDLINDDIYLSLHPPAAASDNIFDQLKAYRTKVEPLEDAVRDHPELSLVARVVVEGHFPYLKKLGLELVDLPGLTENKGVRRALTLNIIQHTNIVALFSHERTPSERDFESIRRGFEVHQTRIPQLIFAHNPYMAFSRGATPDSILNQHTLYVGDALRLVKAQLLAAQNSLERLCFRNMLEKFTPYLFVGHEHSEGLGPLPSECDLEAKVRDCRAQVVVQRLKPTFDYLVSALTEMKIMLTPRSSHQLGSLPRGMCALPSLKDIAESLSDEGIAESFLDEDLFREMCEELYANRHADDSWVRIKGFLVKFTAQRAWIRETLKSIHQAVEDEYRLRLYIVTHLIISGNAGRESLKDLRARLYADYRAAMENGGSFTSPQVEEDQERSAIFQPGRRANVVKEHQSTELAETTFLLSLRTMPHLQARLYRSNRVLDTLEIAQKRRCSSIGRLSQRLKKLESYEEFSAVVREKVEKLIKDLVCGQDLKLEYKRRWDSAFKGLKRLPKERQYAPLKNRDSLLNSVNAKLSSCLEQVQTHDMEASVPILPEPEFSQAQENGTPRKISRTPRPSNPEDAYPAIGRSLEIKVDPALQEDFKIEVGSRGASPITLVAKSLAWREELLAVLQAMDAEEQPSTESKNLHPVFSIGQSLQGKKSKALDPGRLIGTLKRLEGAKTIVYWVLSKDRVKQALEQRSKEEDAEDALPRGLLKIVSTPRSKDPNFVGTCMLLFQQALRRAVQQSTDFENFYYVDERTKMVRMFDEERLDFVPCSPFLALNFLNKVRVHALSSLEPGPSDYKWFTKDQALVAAIKNFSEREELEPMTVMGEISQRQSQIIQAIVNQKPLALMVEYFEDAAFAQSFATRVRELLALPKIYGVGVASSGFTSLSPYSAKSVEGDGEVLTRANYRRSYTGEKPWVLLSASELEGTNLLTEEQFFSTRKSDGPTSPTLRFKDLFTRLEDRGTHGYFAFNFDVKLSH